LEGSVASLEMIQTTLLYEQGTPEMRCDFDIELINKQNDVAFARAVMRSGVRRSYVKPEFIPYPEELVSCSYFQEQYLPMQQLVADANPDGLPAGWQVSEHGVVAWPGSGPTDDGSESMSDLLG
jgi:hypothetical protein